MIRQLRKTYMTRDQAASITQVDTDIFVQRYFRQCLDCTFCFDSCCTYGATVDPENVARIEAHAPALEAYMSIPREQWFTHDYTADAEYVGGRYTRTTVKKTPNGNRCVFLNTDKRGCGIHSFCLESGLDYHEVKPIACWLFPVTFEFSLLRPSHEILERILVCMDQGDTLYQSSRDEIAYYFSAELIAELDQLALDQAAPL